MQFEITTEMDPSENTTPLCIKSTKADGIDNAGFEMTTSTTASPHTTGKKPITFFTITINGTPMIIYL